MPYLCPMTMLRLFIDLFFSIKPMASIFFWRTPFAALPLILVVKTTYADDTVFDTGALQIQGLDSALATQFPRENAFPPGLNLVSLKVNGMERGRHQIWFDKTGGFCPSAALLRHAGLKVPSGIPENPVDKLADQQTCVDLTSIWPQFTVEADPGDGTLSLIVPQEALDAQSENIQWQQNGSAALLNYNTRYLVSQARDSNINYWQVQTEAGFNAGNWLFRSNQSVYRFGEHTQTDYQNAYVQHTFTRLKSTLQAGQVPLSGGLFGIGQVIGFQMTPEQALYSQQGAAIVSGIADAPSVVEIRQLGIPVYHTTVPAGPFSLSGFALLNTRTDLSVTLTATDGSQRNFLVPSSVYARDGATISPGVSWGMGRYDQQGIDKKPFVGVVSKGFQLLERTALQAGVMGSDKYQAVSAAVNSTFLWQTSLAMQTIVARDASAHQGTLSSLSLSQPLGQNVSLNINGTHQDRGYREFSETLVPDQQDIVRNKNQYGGGLTWSQAWLGSLSFSVGRSTQTRGAPATWSQLSWGRQFGRATVNVIASRNQSGSFSGHDDRLYLSLTLPLGQDTSLNTSSSRSQDGWRYGSRVDQRLSQDRNWSLAVNRDQGREQNDATGTFSTVTRWSNLTGSLSADSSNSRSLSLQAGGSVVAHGGGITFAPYSVSDTFGIAKVGNKAGVRLVTSAGPVWTDGNGYAVLPSLASWTRSGVEVDTRSLGRRDDVLNGIQEVLPARGSVSQVRFDTISTRRVLVNMQNNAAERLTPGTAVYDADNNFVTVVDEDGNFFLPDASPDSRFSIETKTRECRITLDNLPQEPDENAGLYEIVSGVCR